MDWMDDQARCREIGWCFQGRGMWFGRAAGIAIKARDKLKQNGPRLATCCTLLVLNQFAWSSWRQASRRPRSEFPALVVVACWLAASISLLVHHRSSARSRQTRLAVSGSALHHVSPALVSARLASRCLACIARSISQNLYLCILDASCMQKKLKKKTPSAKVWGRRAPCPAFPGFPPTSPGCVPLSTAASALANDQE